MHAFFPRCREEFPSTRVRIRGLIRLSSWHTLCEGRTVVHADTAGSRSRRDVPAGLIACQRACPVHTDAISVRGAAPRAWGRRAAADGPSVCAGGCGRQSARWSAAVTGRGSRRRGTGHLVALAHDDIAGARSAHERRLGGRARAQVARRPWASWAHAGCLCSVGGFGAGSGVAQDAHALGGAVDAGVGMPRVMQNAKCKKARTRIQHER